MTANGDEKIHLKKKMNYYKEKLFLDSTKQGKKFLTIFKGTGDTDDLKSLYQYLKEGNDTAVCHGELAVVASLGEAEDARNVDEDVNALCKEERDDNQFFDIF